MRRAEFWDVSVRNRVKQIERDIEENKTEKTEDFFGGIGGRRNR